MRPLARFAGSLRDRIAPRYERELERAVGDVASVLDLGCGTDSPLARFDRRYQHTIGVDLFAETLAQSRAREIHSAYRLLDVRELEASFEPRSFDVVLAVDLLEHLAEPDGLALLRAMEGVARRRVVVFTPSGYVPQGPRDGNPLQAHRSGWTARRMRELGYEVRGVHGLRFLRGELGAIRWAPRRPWGAISDLTQPLVRRLPSLAFHLLCVKQVG